MHTNSWPMTVCPSEMVHETEVHVMVCTQAVNKPSMINQIRYGIIM